MSSEMMSVARSGKYPFPDLTSGLTNHLEHPWAGNPHFRENQHTGHRENTASVTSLICVSGGVFWTFVCFFSLIP